jgi:hypothetical protein
MVGALYSCHRQKNRRFSVVGHRRGIHALDCLLFKFFSFTLGLTHGLVVAGLEALVAVGASIAECLLLHHGKRCNGCLAAIQHHIATRVAVGIFFARSFLNQIANTVQILIGQLVRARFCCCAALPVMPWEPVLQAVSDKPIVSTKISEMGVRITVVSKNIGGVMIEQNDRGILGALLEWNAHPCLQSCVKP